jgi:hypothetical protein
MQQSYSEVKWNDWILTEYLIILPLLPVLYFNIHIASSGSPVISTGSELLHLKSLIYLFSQVLYVCMYLLIYNRIKSMQSTQTLRKLLTKLTIVVDHLILFIYYTNKSTAAWQVSPKRRSGQQYKLRYYKFVMKKYYFILSCSFVRLHSW